MNRYHFHSHIKSEMNENGLIKKKLIIRDNVTFIMTQCGCEGYFDEEIEENEMEDVGIDDVNIACISLNSSNKKI